MIATHLALRASASAWQRLRRCAAWLAIVAVILNGFAPGLHRAVMAQAGSDRVVLCTHDGPVTVADADFGGVPSGPSPSAADDCCGLCILGTAMVLAPAGAMLPLPIGSTRAARPTADVASARPLSTGPPLPARGPPLFS